MSSCEMTRGFRLKMKGQTSQALRMQPAEIHSNYLVIWTISVGLNITECRWWMKLPQWRHVGVCTQYVHHVWECVSVCVGASVMDQAISGMAFLCVCVMDQPISTQARWQRGAEDAENGRTCWCNEQNSDVFPLPRFKHFTGLFLPSKWPDSQGVLRLHFMLEYADLLILTAFLHTVRALVSNLKPNVPSNGT